MKKKTDPPPSLPAFPAPPGRAVILLALGMTATFVAVLSLRPVMSVDVGYHLAYGEQFLRTGQIVDSSEFIYTCDPSLAPARRPEPGPGCWYDQNGEYRFPNANWLSQVIMALTHRLGGMRALSILTAAMVVATMAAAFVAMRRCGVGPLASAGGVVLAALAGYERFNMRPELPGYLILLIQVAILVPAAGEGRTISRRALVAIVALQILLVNLHSYFLLALAMTGAVLADRLGRWLWRRLVVRNGQEADPLTGQTRWLAILLAAQTAACLVNPWTWRLAILPVQTLLYLRRHHVSAAAGGEHPWANIVEFYPTFTAGAFSAPIVMGVYVAILALAGAGILAALWRRRWAWAGILAGAAAVSCSMRRNISVTSAVMACIALASLWDLIAPRPGRKSRPEWLGMAVAAGLAVVSMALAVSVVSQRFYAWEGSSYRFGVGIDRVWTPLAAAEWINANQPDGRLWTDANVSSNMCYFTNPHRWVPSLTNTWAYPPATFKESLELVAGRRKLPANGTTGTAVVDGFEPVRRAYDVEMVAIYVAPLLASVDAPSLGNSLVKDPRWRLVSLDAQHVLFLRSDGPNAALARRAAIEPSPLLPADAPPAAWMVSYVDRLRHEDPLPACSLRLGGRTCQYLGFLNEAIELFTQSLGLDPAQPAIWNQLGKAHADRAGLRMRGTPRLPGDRLAAARDFAAARQAFQKAADLGSPQAAENLRRLP